MDARTRELVVGAQFACPLLNDGDLRLPQDRGLTTHVEIVEVGPSLGGEFVGSAAGRRREPRREPPGSGATGLDEDRE
jgi:hypothetical protein